MNAWQRWSLAVVTAVAVGVLSVLWQADQQRLDEIETQLAAGVGPEELEVLRERVEELEDLLANQTAEVADALAAATTDAESTVDDRVSEWASIYGLDQSAGSSDLENRLAALEQATGVLSSATPSGLPRRIDTLNNCVSYLLGHNHEPLSALGEPNACRLIDSGLN